MTTHMFAHTTQIKIITENALEPPIIRCNLQPHLSGRKNWEAPLWQLPLLRACRSTFSLTRRYLNISFFLPPWEALVTDGACQESGLETRLLISTCHLHRIPSWLHGWLWLRCYRTQITALILWVYYQKGGTGRSLLLGPYCSEHLIFVIVVWQTCT